MSEDIKFEVVESVPPPPKARVETPAETLERKKDYLEGFLAQKPEPVASGEAGGDVYEAVIATLKEIFDPEIPVNIYDLGLIYNVALIRSSLVLVRAALRTAVAP